MHYLEFEPHPLLRPHIVCYWTMQNGDAPQTNTIFSDGCSDIIFNLGADVDGGDEIFRYGQRYLVGIMTRYKQIRVAPAAHLLGIRFKPFGISTLTGMPLKGTSNESILLSQHELQLPELHDVSPASIQKLNAFFLQHLRRDSGRWPAVIDTIHAAGGNVSIRQIAQRHAVTERSVERYFQQHAGCTVKELCKQVRFQRAITTIKASPQSTFAQIAFDAGYYDHTHLLKDVKQYTGLTLSEIR